MFCQNKTFVQTGLFVAGFAVIIGVMLAKIFYLFPVLHEFPQCTGSYAVGTSSYYWVDESRSELYSSNPSDKRELVVRFWYPTQKDATQKTYSYVSDQQKITIRKNLKDVYIPDCIWAHLVNIKSTVIPNAACSSDKNPYPVVMFSHGAGSLPDLYITYLAELVSHGYIVVGINHTYISDGTTFPDGRTIVHKSMAMPLEKIIEIMVADVRFIIDKLEGLQKKEEPFFKKLDLTNIGVLGHSMGGDTALEVCRIDERCKAGIDMDGWSIGVHSLQGFHKPFLFLLGEYGLLSSPMPTDKELHDMGTTQESWREQGIKGLQEIDQLCSSMGNYCHKIVVGNVGHGEFSDTILLKKPLDRFIYPSWARLQSPNPRASIKAINTYVLDFFDVYLR